MATRRKFTRDERAAFTVEAAVEWHNGGGHWHPATVTREAFTDSIGIERVEITNHATTRSIGKGQTVYAAPGNLRVPAAQDPGSDKETGK